MYTASRGSWPTELAGKRGEADSILPVNRQNGVQLEGYFFVYFIARFGPTSAP
jgi:hypothetical protein